MPIVVVVGAQWGDEGKGKIVDLLSADARLVVRYQGGNNAGHTLVVGGERRVLHLLPSGALRPGCVGAIGAGVVVDPEVLLGEIDALAVAGRRLGPAELVIDPRAHVILPHHRQLDLLRERRAGSAAIGTTGRGIGPCYEDKAGRRGVRVEDLVDPDRCLARVRDFLPEKEALIRWLGGEPPDATAVEAVLLAAGARLAPYVGEVAGRVRAARADGGLVILEGAQGTDLDLDRGTWPFVTSSTTVSGGACASVGVGPTAIDAVVGIAKAYTTRVGAGPFPTEASEPEQEWLRAAGHEFGATTGRPRRCGWFDVPRVREAAALNGLTSLVLTKLDVLSGLEWIPVAVEHGADGPIYEQLPGWDEDLSAARTVSELPAACRAYVARLEALVGVPIDLVSVGAARDATLGLEALRDRLGQRSARG